MVSDPDRSGAFPLFAFYPTLIPSQPVNFGPYRMELSPDAPLDDSGLPLVVLSHGAGGTHLVYRTLAEYLARHGYVVIVPEHPGNNRTDNSLDGTRVNLENRPRHIRSALDAIFADPVLGPRLRPDQCAMIGHSLGGYTALAVAGGQPWWSPEQKLPVSHDERVKALVLLAPSACWFIPNEALREVTAPILLFTAEKDHITPRWQAQLILDLVPDRTRVTHEIVANAGHYSFLSPFPAILRRETLPPSQDPPGFDRPQFHELMNARVRAFLDRHLPATTS